MKNFIKFIPVLIIFIIIGCNYRFGETPAQHTERILTEELKFSKNRIDKYNNEMKNLYIEYEKLVTSENKNIDYINRLKQCKHELTSKLDKELINYMSIEKKLKMVIESRLVYENSGRNNGRYPIFMPMPVPTPGV